MSNYSLITNQTFDVVKANYTSIPENSDFNDMNYLNEDNSKIKYVGEKKQPLLTQKEINDFFADENSNYQLPNSVKVEEESFNKQKSVVDWLSNKSISLKTLVLIFISFVAGVALAIILFVAYYSYKNNISIVDKKISSFEKQLENEKLMFETTKSKIDELSIRVDAITNHLSSESMPVKSE